MSSGKLRCTSVELGGFEPVTFWTITVFGRSELIIDTGTLIVRFGQKYPGFTDLKTNEVLT